MNRDSITFRIGQALEAQLDVPALLATGDPYSEQFAVDFARLLDSQIAGHLIDILNLTEITDPAKALRNVWAVAMAEPIHLVVLGQLARRDGPGMGLAEEVERLVRLSTTRSLNPVDSLLISAGNPDLTPPDLGLSTELRPGLRLRYRLASGLSDGMGAEGLLSVALAQTNTTDYLLTRELERCFIAFRRRSPKEPLLHAYDLVFMGTKACDLIVGSPRLQSLLIAEQTDSKSLRLQIRNIEKNIEEKKSALHSHFDDLVNADFSRLEDHIEPDNPVSLRVLALHLKGLRQRSLHSQTVNTKALRKPVPWQSVPARLGARLQGLGSKFEVPFWWCVSTEALASHLARSMKSAPSFTPVEETRLIQTWTERQERELLAAGFTNLVNPASPAWDSLPFAKMREQLVAAKGSSARILGKRLARLSDPTPALEWMAAEPNSGVRALLTDALRYAGSGRYSRSVLAWALPAFGTPAWNQVAAELRRHQSLPGAIFKHLQMGGEFQRPDLVNIYLQSQLTLGAATRARQVRWWYEWMLVSPVDALNTVSMLHGDLVRAILDHEDLTGPLLEQLYARLPPMFEPALLRSRVRVAINPGAAKAALLELASRPLEEQGELKIQRWSWTASRSGYAADAYVLLHRADPQNLAKLAFSMGEEKFCAAARRVARQLPSSQRQSSGILDLCAELGPDIIQALFIVLGLSDRNASSGSKLDAAYRRYFLPKKSGGKRVISVPDVFLKEVQRRVLERLLYPLGQHPAATGFVRGKSIKDNAQVHVCQSVVANVDISNCFPSVRWQLVLGVLRRDLGSRLTPGALSILVDICTAQGGLPIGAPTSPALLNRVLEKTDQVLTDASKGIGCKYTRYADDLTFSGDHGAVELIGVATRTLAQIGLSLDSKKTNIFRPGRRQMVTGLVVNAQVSVPRRIRKRLRAAVHAVEQGKETHWHGQPTKVETLKGRLSFLHMIQPAQAETLRRRLAATHTSSDGPTAAQKKSSSA